MSNVKQALNLIIEERDDLLAQEETYGPYPEKERKLRKVIDILRTIES